MQITGSVNGGGAKVKHEQTELSELGEMRCQLCHDGFSSAIFVLGLSSMFLTFGLV